MDLHKANYRAWLISEADFPAIGTLEDKIKFLVGYGVLAPSQHNTQPWLFGVSGDRLTISPDMSRKLAVGDAQNHGLYIALGACTENIVQAGEWYGLESEVRIKDGIVDVRFTESPAKQSDDVLASIKGRYSNKAVYTGERVPFEVVDRLESGSRHEMVRLKLVTSEKVLRKIAKLHLKAASQVSDNLQFVRELTEWLRTNKTKAVDGMPGFVMGFSGPKSAVAKILLKRKPTLFKKAVYRDGELMNSASIIAVWGVKDLKFDCLVECGRSIERLWLSLAREGLAAHPMAASVSSPETARELALLIGMSETPVFLMRVGYGKESGLRTPRRSGLCS